MAVEREITVASTFNGNIPQTIPFNIIDRVFFIAESDDKHGDYFPMSLVRGTRLKSQINRSQLITALEKVDARFPQLRIGYRIDLDKLVLRRVSDTDRRDHFNQIIQEFDDDLPFDDIIARLIARNPVPIGLPLNVVYRGDWLFISISHAIGDASFLTVLSKHLLTALFNPQQFDQLPELEPNFWIPISDVIWHKPQQAFTVLGRAMMSILEKVFRFTGVATGQASSTVAAIEHHPVVSGSEIGVLTSIIDEESLRTLFSTRKKIIPGEKVTLNNVIQVEIARRLQQKGYIQDTITYIIPVDLRRYTGEDKAFYPGNLSSQIRITLTEQDLVKTLQTLQAESVKRLNNYEPLINMPAEWITNLLPRNVYDRLHQSWLLKPALSSERFFVLSNLGKLDAAYEGLEAFIHLDQSTILAPLDSPLVILFSTINGRGQLTASFDPAIISYEDVRSILDFNNQSLTILEEGNTLP